MKNWTKGWVYPSRTGAPTLFDGWFFKTDTFELALAKETRKKIPVHVLYCYQLGIKNHIIEGKTDEEARLYAIGYAEGIIIGLYEAIQNLQHVD